MNLPEAFEILHSSEKNSFEEIKKSYHDLSKTNHPDLVQNSDLAISQVRLNEAFEMIEAYYKIRNAVIPTETGIKIFKEISDFQKTEELRKQSEKDVDNYRNRLIVPYKIGQTISWIIAGIMLIIGFSSKLDFVFEEYLGIKSYITSAFEFQLKILEAISKMPEQYFDAAQHDKCQEVL